MNEFEKRMNALRRQYAAERAQITKDTYRHIGHLNTAIGQSAFLEVREALRAEKERVYEAMRTSHKYNRICYRQQLEMLEDEYNIHLSENPSRNKLRRMMYTLCKTVENEGKSTLKISCGDNRHATISFS